MSHFSRITLDADHRDAASALNLASDANAQREHQWLWQFFPGDPDARRDFVFRRMEPRGSRQGPLYYMVSQRKPTAPHPAWCVKERDYDPELRGGQRYAFELRVNPVITRQGHRHDVVMDAKTALARQAGHASWSQLPGDQQAAIVEQGYGFIQKKILAWLADREARPGFARRHGFSIAANDIDREPLLRVDGYRRHRLARKDRNRQERAWLTSVDLCGELVVEDAPTFRAALLNGVGHGKAWGCGLLLIRAT